MASHGIPRVSEVDPQTDQTRQKQQQRIAEYRALVAHVQEVTRSEHPFTALPLTSKLLAQNPEYYTIWNERRRILDRHFDSIVAKSHSLAESEDTSQVSPQAEIANLLGSDLAFIFPLLVKFPKCYWIWNHRLWLLQQSTRRLSAAVARKLWTDELNLATKMLAKDSRNFHGWGYRRMVVVGLESQQSKDGGGDVSKEEPTSMTKSEFDYTTRMINTNLSNFSAWHTRSKLILRILDEEKADDSSRRKLLDDELQLILEALYTDPYDQSLWFYHTYLTTTFAPSPQMKRFSIVPSLSNSDQASYIAAEIDKLKEMLPEAEDCKWIYQRLLELSLDHRELVGAWPPEVKKDDTRNWLDELLKLDPLRAGRWEDLRKRLNII